MLGKPVKIRETIVMGQKLASSSNRGLRKTMFMPFVLALLHLKTCSIYATPPIPRPEGYGSVSGRIVFHGDVPKLRPLQTKSSLSDKAICGKQIPNQSLLVNDENRGIKNVFVYVRKTFYPHPTMRESEAKDVEQTIDGCQFSPRTLIFNKEQSAVLRPVTKIVHSIRAFPSSNRSFPSIAISDSPVTLDKFRNDEVVPFKVQCEIHPWMKSYWLILATRYGTTTDVNGQFTIPKLRAGDHRLTIWHERAGVIEKQLKFDVQKDKTTDLGTIKLRIDRFKLQPDELE